MFETLGFTLAEFEHFLLMAMRISAIFFTVAIFSSRITGVHWKLFISFYIAYICTGIVAPPPTLPVSILYLATYSINEILVGVAIGLSTNFLFEVLAFAGFFTSRIMGLSMLTIIDPTTNERTVALGQFFYFFAIMLLFSTNAHHFYITSIFESFHIIPTTTGAYNPMMNGKVIQLVSSIFLLGIKLGAPLVVILFLEKVLLAIFSKVNPEMNVFVLGMPLGILIGFYILIYFWPYFSYIFWKIFEQYKVETLNLMRLMGGR